MGSDLTHCKNRIIIFSESQKNENPQKEMSSEDLHDYLTNHHCYDEFITLDINELAGLGFTDIATGPISRSWSCKVTETKAIFSNSIYTSAKQIFALYQKYGSADYIGENITQMEHGTQCARRAQEDPRLDEYPSDVASQIIIAAFLHDIGHLLGLDRADAVSMVSVDGNSLGIYGHEQIGADYLMQCGMPQLVCDLVRSHVNAKRYLCTINVEYHSRLSEASKGTLKLQGGQMSDEELYMFENSPIFRLSLMLRSYDDGGKDVDHPSSMIEAELFTLMLDSCL
jgi:predicted HD phosphohydrolase